MDVQVYLQRINYHGPLEPTAETLRRLQAAHLLTVPFENLDIHLGRPILLDEAALFHKIVEQRRGGFCYELNGAFAGLLRQLGFEATMLSARVKCEGGGFGPEFDHMALLVALEERWLVDVGFGDSFREPLRLDDPGDQVRFGNVYRLEPDGAEYRLAERKDEAWEIQYLFTLQPRRLQDFAEMCHYHQTSPESSFIRRRVCTQATGQGRITLSDRRLIITANGHRQEQPILDDAAFAHALQTYFAIRLQARATPAWNSPSNLD